MNNLIKFPGKYSIKPSKEAPKEEELDLNQNLSILDSKEEDAAVFSLIREWPCFQHISNEMTLSDLTQLYYDDELTPSQDLVIEFIFHMNDVSPHFDISNALYTWDEEDRYFFFLSLDIHIQLVKQGKNQELN